MVTVLKKAKMPLCLYYHSGDIYYSAGIEFNQSEYIIRESVMNHTIPVSITGGRLPVDTSVQVLSENDTAGTEKFLFREFLFSILICFAVFATL